MSRREIKVRLWKAFLILLAAFLIFAGPTYVAYLARQVGVSPIYSIAFGFALLILGVAIAYRLVKSGEIK